MTIFLAVVVSVVFCFLITLLTALAVELHRHKNTIRYQGRRLLFMENWRNRVSRAMQRELESKKCLADRIAIDYPETASTITQNGVDPCCAACHIIDEQTKMITRLDRELTEVRRKRIGDAEKIGGMMTRDALMREYFELMNRPTLRQKDHRRIFDLKKQLEDHWSAQPENGCLQGCDVERKA